jgi:hypothetical protein
MKKCNIKILLNVRLHTAVYVYTVNPSIHNVNLLHVVLHTGRRISESLVHLPVPSFHHKPLCYNEQQTCVKRQLVYGNNKILNI